MWYKNEQIFNTFSDIRQSMPNTSLPYDLTDEVLLELGFEKIIYTPNPATVSQVGTQDGTEIDLNGNRVIKWSIRDKTPDELETERKASVPTQITPRQLRLQLLAVTLLDEVETLCATDRAMSIWFEYSLDFQRSHPMVEAMAVQLGLTQDDLDTMFIEASKL